MGISHSHYLGGPARFTDEDRAKFDALAEWEAGLCDMCGTHADWWNPDHGGHRFAFIADLRRCPGCEVKDELQDQLDSKTSGAHVFLRPNPALTGEED